MNCKTQATMWILMTQMKKVCYSIPEKANFQAPAIKRVSTSMPN